MFFQTSSMPIQGQASEAPPWPIDPLTFLLKISEFFSWSNRLDKKQENLSHFGEFFLHLEEFGEPPS